MFLNNHTIYIIHIHIDTQVNILSIYYTLIPWHWYICTHNTTVHMYTNKHITHCVIVCIHNELHIICISISNM